MLLLSRQGGEMHARGRWGFKREWNRLSPGRGEWMRDGRSHPRMGREQNRAAAHGTYDVLGRASTVMIVAMALPSSGRSKCVALRRMRRMVLSRVWACRRGEERRGRGTGQALRWARTPSERGRGGSWLALHPSK